MAEQAKFPAAVWTLGLYGLAGATFFMGAQMTAWGMSRGPLLLLSAVFGMLPVLAAAWAYRAADALATALLGTWGALLLGCSVVRMLAVAEESVASVEGPRALGFLFFLLAAVTWMTMGPAVTRSAALGVVCTFLALSSTGAAIAHFTSSPSFVLAAGLLLEIAAGCASYTANAILLKRAFGRTILPIG